MERHGCCFNSKQTDYGAHQNHPVAPGPLYTGTGQSGNLVMVSDQCSS